MYYNTLVIWQTLLSRLRYSDEHMQSNFDFSVMLKDTLTDGLGGTRDQTADPVISGWPTLPPPYPQPALYHGISYYKYICYSF